MLRTAADGSLLQVEVSQDAGARRFVKGDAYYFHAPMPYDTCSTASPGLIITPCSSASPFHHFHHLYA